ncbi:NAD(P)H-dependent oxidoreductase [Candidatus Uhrbacteria bacterium]|nr:NAD(P)H-dependent oxidoreductase [Candidatus Uhrbacteria bacterium]
MMTHSPAASQSAILAALQWRYAVKIFDPTRRVASEDLHTILESGRLAPSSYGVEPWKFLVIENQELRRQLRAVAYDQPKVTDAAHLIVIARRTDVRARIAAELAERTARAQGRPPEALAGLQQMVDEDITRRSNAEVDAWARAQTYLPLGIMVMTAALLGVDAGPMEGFTLEKVDAILHLSERHLAATTMLALGYRGDDPAAERPKVRRTFAEAVEFLP